MHYDDHAPAHFHAHYGKYRISVNIKNGTVIGEFPRRALLAVLEWYVLHQDELMENWEACMNHGDLKPIAPLE